MENGKVRIAAIADIHVQKTDKDRFRDYFIQISKKADILLICGDLTNTGDPQEAEVLNRELQYCDIPVLAVLGNHDYEKKQTSDLLKILQNEKIHLLDGDFFMINNIGFAGVKGFCGGFDPYKLFPFGEPAIKSFVDETQVEVRRLDNALARLDREFEAIPKIVLLHYAPIEETVKGEPEMIYPFLGSSRLAEPLIKHHVLAAFHGHAHAGRLEGSVSGVKIFNVAHEVLLKAGLELPFLLFEV